MISSEGVNIDQYIENCVKGGHEFLLKRDAKNDLFSDGKKLVKIVSVFLIN
jgi:hypothetical protein